MKKFLILLSFIFLVSCSTAIDRNDEKLEARYITKIVNVEGIKKIRFSGVDKEYLNNISKNTNIPLEEVEKMVEEKMIILLENNKLTDENTNIFMSTLDYMTEQIKEISFKEILDIGFKTYMENN